MKNKFLLIVISSLLIFQIIGCGKNPFISVLNKGGVPITANIGKIPSTTGSYSPSFIVNSRGISRSVAANTPTSIKLKVVTIALEKDDGNKILLYDDEKGMEVDLAILDNNLGTRSICSGQIPPGKYKSVEIRIAGYLLVKASVTIDGTTYKTRTNHTGYETSDEPEEEKIYINAEHPSESGYSIITPLYNVEINSETSINIYMDVEDIIAFWDGTGNHPWWVHVDYNKGFGVLIPPDGIVVTVGQPLSAELYMAPNKTGPAGVKIALFFDSNGNFLGGGYRSKIKGDGVWGNVDPFESGEVFSSFEKNSDGTYTGRFGAHGYRVVEISPFRRDFGSQTCNFRYIEGPTYFGQFTYERIK
jgi:hypothetical protein